MDRPSNRRRFEALRKAEADGILTKNERIELDRMITDLEEAEAALLRPAIQRTQEERLRLAEQNTALKGIIRRQKRLAQRLERILAASRSERQNIAAELTQLLGGTLRPMS